MIQEDILQSFILWVEEQKYFDQFRFRKEEKENYSCIDIDTPVCVARMKCWNNGYFCVQATDIHSEDAIYEKFGTFSVETIAVEFSEFFRILEKGWKDEDSIDQESS